MDQSSKCPLLSVIVPVCNVEKYLHECMDSIENQIMEDIEVICINDGSTDSSLEILEDYASRDSRITIIDKPNAGYGAAMNDGLDAASGRFLTILESDDFATRDGWSKLVELCIKHDLDIAKGCYMRHSDIDEFFKVYEKTDVHCPPWIGKIPSNTIFNPRDALRVFWMTPSIWSCVYDRSFLEKNEIRFNETPGASFQDTGFFFGVWSSAQRAMIVDDVILHYRIDNSGSSSKSTKKVHAVRTEMDFAENYLFEHDADVIFRQVLCSIRYKTYLWNLKRIADEYADEFREGMKADLTSDVEHGSFSPLLFNKKDENAYVACIESNPSKKELDSDTLLQTSPLLSVIVTPSNKPEKLRGCLQSLKNQTYEKIEIICMIDNQNESIIEVVSSFCDSDSRFNKFVCGKADETSFRDALLLSHGQYCLFANTDYPFTKFALKRLAATEYTNNANIVFFENLDFIEPDPEYPERKNRLFRDNEAMHIASDMFNSNLFEFVFERRFGEDTEIYKTAFCRWDESNDGDRDIVLPRSIDRVIIAKAKNPFLRKPTPKKSSSEKTRVQKKRPEKRGLMRKLSRVFRSKNQ